MKYLIDTCVISEFVKSKPNSHVRNWFNEQQETQVFLSAVSIAEIKKGINKIIPYQPESALILNRWLKKLELSFSKRTISINDDVLEQWANFSATIERQGVNMAVMNGLIAATAHTYNLTLVTRNVSDFNGLPIKIINPFDPPVT